MNTRTRWWFVTIAVGLGAVLLTGCGGSDEEPPPGDADQVSADPEGDADASDEQPALTLDTLADHCEDLADVVTELRGEEPVEIEASDPMNVTGDHEYRTAHCTYAYEGDSFSDKNRVDIYLDGAGTDPAQIHELWDALSTTSSLAGIGDDATWYENDAFELKSTARALVGDLIISVRVSVPHGNEGAPYLTQDAVVAALEAVVDRV